MYFLENDIKIFLMLTIFVHLTIFDNQKSIMFYFLRYLERYAISQKFLLYYIVNVECILDILFVC